MFYKCLLLSICYVLNAADQSDYFFIKGSSGVYTIDRMGTIVSCNVSDSYVSEDRQHTLIFDEKSVSWNISDINGKKRSVLNETVFFSSKFMPTVMLSGKDAMSFAAPWGSVLRSVFREKEYKLLDSIVVKMGFVRPVPDTSVLVGVLKTYAKSQFFLILIDMASGVMTFKHEYSNPIRFFSTHENYIAALSDDGILHKGILNRYGNYKHEKSIDVSKLMSLYIASDDGLNTVHLDQYDSVVLGNGPLIVNKKVEASCYAFNYYNIKDFRGAPLFPRMMDMVLVSKDKLFVTCCDTIHIEEVTI